MQYTSENEILSLIGLLRAEDRLKTIVLMAMSSLLAMLYDVEALD